MLATYVSPPLLSTGRVTRPSMGFHSPMCSVLTAMVAVFTFGQCAPRRGPGRWSKGQIGGGAVLCEEMWIGSLAVSLTSAFTFAHSFTAREA